MPPFSKLLRWLLPASMVVNVFLSAALCVHLLVDWTRPAPPPMMPPRMLEDMLHTLSPEDGALLRTALDTSLAAIQDSRQAEAGLPETLRNILRKDPFDEAAFRAALQAPQKGRDLLTAALPAALAKLSPDGRRRLAEFHPPFENHGPEGRRPGGRPPEGPEGGEGRPGGPDFGPYGGPGEEHRHRQ